MVWKDFIRPLKTILLISLALGIGVQVSKSPMPPMPPTSKLTRSQANALLARSMMNTHGLVTRAVIVHTNSGPSHVTILFDGTAGWLYEVDRNINDQGWQFWTNLSSTNGHFSVIDLATNNKCLYRAKSTFLR